MADVWHGPAGWEDPAPRRYGPVSRVAVVSDVHANVAALTAVLADIEAADVELIVSCGDLTWGSYPDETIAAMRGLGDRALFVRGNGERAVLEISDERRRAGSPRESWVPAQHSASSLKFVAAIPFSIVIEIIGLGPVRFCHGSPRSDTEIITTLTPDERLGEILAADDNPPTIVGGHTHRLFDRRAYRWRFINAGSVGMPYEGRAGAFWALLGPDVELRYTAYDVTAAIAELRAGGFDDVDEMFEESLLNPMDPDAVAQLFEQGVPS